MICTSKEAESFKCCSMPKMCEGDKCMAWTQYKEDRTILPKGKFISPTNLCPYR